MPEYQDDFKEFSKGFFWFVPRVIGMLLFIGVLLGGVGWAINLLSQPGSIIGKTMNADNVINNYEFFHDANNQYMARVAQIKSQKSVMQDNTDDSEKTKLRIELGAMQQSCRELVAKYNSNAIKTNRSIFMGREAPDHLNPLTCE